MKMAKIQIYRWWSPHSTECCTIESHNTNWSPNQYGKERNNRFCFMEDSCCIQYECINY